MNHAKKPVIPRTLLFVGDSITDAFRRPEERNISFQLGNGYVFLLASEWAFLSNSTLPFIRNEGVSGFTSEEIKKKWEDANLAKAVDFTVFLGGVNDYIGSHRNKGDLTFTVERLQRNLRTMMKGWMARGHGRDRFLIVMPFLFPSGVYNEKELADFEKIRKGVQDVALEFESPVLDPLPAFISKANEIGYEAISYDGIHLSPAGCYVLKEELKKLLIQWEWIIPGSTTLP